MAAIESFMRDVAFGLRLFRKSPLFAAAAALTLALGVGVNTAIFSVVNALILRPLPVRDSDRLTVVATRHASSRALGAVSYADLQDYRAATTGVFEDIAGYTVGFLGVAVGGRRPDRVLATSVTRNYFTMLDLRPEVGALIDEDDRSTPVLVLGYTTWQRRFGGDRSLIGRPAYVNGRPYVIIGVAPPGFAGAFAFSESEIYLPIDDDPSGHRDRRGLHALGRLRLGVALEQAQSTMAVVAARLEQEHPNTNRSVGVTLVPERLARPEEDQARSNSRVAAIMLALVGLVLLVAVINVTNLLLARATGRRRELAIRAALGAGRGRLVRQLVTESLMLSAAGGVAGVVLGTWAGRALSTVRLPGDLPVLFDFHFDGRVLAYTLTLIMCMGLLIGLVSALRSSRTDVERFMRDAGYGLQMIHGRQSLRSLLVVAQIAACFVLLSAAGLLARSLARAERTDLGFRPDGVLNLQMDVGQLGYDERRGRAFFDDIDERVAKIPGVQDLSFAFTVPLGYISVGDRLHAEGQSGATADRPIVRKNMVGSRYFTTMGIVIVRGRPFRIDDNERSRPVAIVNERLAEMLWPGQDALGRRFSSSGPGGPWIEVVGVTTTGKYRMLFEDPLPYFYVPIAQHYTGLRVLHVRTSLAPDMLTPAIERVIQAREPDLPIYDVQSMTAALGGGYGLFLVRAGAVAAAMFGMLGLALAAVGIFGVVSYLVGQRTREIGIRMALGASGLDILRLVLREGAVLMALGLASGLVMALWSARFLGAFLFGVSSADPLTFAGVAQVLVTVAAAACVVPVRRALRVNPATTLRSD